MSDLSKLSTEELMQMLQAHPDAAAPPATPSPQDYAKTFGDRARASGDPADIQMAMMADKDAAKKPDFMSGERLDYGLGDPLYGIAQFGAHVIPGIDPSGMDKRVQDREAEYNSKRQAAGQTGHDWYRTGGNLAASAPLMMALPAAAPESLMGAMGQGAALGTANSIMQPVTSGDYGMEKGKQVLEGAASGALTSGLAYGAGRLVGGAGVPKNDYDKALQYLQSKGVDPTIGQMAGKNAAKFEDIAQPFSVFGQNRALDQFNRAAYNEVLAPIGEKHSGEVGRGAVKIVGDKLSAAYEKLVPSLKLVPDAQLQADFAAAVGKSDEMSEAAAAQFAKIVEKQLPRGPLEGESLKKLQSALTEKISQFSGSQDPSHQMMADAFADIRTAITDNLSRVNPKYAEKLQAIDHGWANLVRLELASGKTGDGVFTPNQLLTAARQADDTVRSRAIARGMGGDMQTLADAGIRILGNKYPNSGTPARLAVGALEGGGLTTLAAAHPVGVGSVAATGLAYTPWGQKALSTALGPRQGQVLPLMGKALKSSASPLAMGASQLFPRLMGP